MKVLHITKMKGISGSENHLLTLLSGLNKSRFVVHLGILVEAGHVPLLQEYKKTLEKAGVAVSIFMMHKYVDLSLLWRLRNYILQEQFHIVHTHLIHADFYGTFAAKLSGVKTIISSRHNDDRFRRYLPLIWLNRFLARWHNKVIVISDWVGKFLQHVEGIPAEKIVRIHYGLQPEPIMAQANPQYIRQQFRIPALAPVIGTIGRLTEQKGHSYLLQATQKVRACFPDIHVVIVGDGELRTELEKQVRELKIEDNIIFMGFKSRDETIQLLSGFDLFVFPSLWEGLGLVLLEAMALQKAVVASNVSAIPESVLDGKRGLLVLTKDAEKLAEAIITLLSDNERICSMGKAGYRRLIENFTVAKMVQNTEILYTEVLK